MAEQLILKAGTAEITTKIARFGPISYQIANIGSVAVYLDKKLNLIAIALFFAALALGFWAFNLNAQRAEQTQVVAAIAITSAVVAFFIQSFWPKKVFTFVLKTSSNDVHKIVSENGEHLDSLHTAIETAFIERG